MDARRTLALCLALTGCAPNGCQEGGQVPMLAAREKAQVAKRVIGAAQENAQRQCPRPTLRGEATPGSGEEALRALVQIDGAQHTCFNALADTKDQARALLKAPDEAALSAPLTPELETAAAACAMLPEKIAAAAAYGALCNPFMFGRADEPKDLKGVLYLGYGAALQARMLYRSGKPMEGARLLLDTLRLLHDLRRGGSTLVVDVMTATALGPVLAEATKIFDSPQLSAAELATLGKELAQLQQTQPGFTGALAHDLMDTVYRTGLRDVQPADWRPEGAHPPPPSSRHLTPEDRESSWLALMAVEESVLALEKMCPKGAPLPDCLKALARWDEIYVEVGKAQDEAALSQGDVPRSLVALRREQLQILHNVGTPDFSNLLRRAATHDAALQALRLQVATHAAAGGGGRCPDLAALDQAPLRALRSVKALGETLALTERDDGRWFTLPAERLGFSVEGTPIIALGGVHCLSSGQPPSEAQPAPSGERPADGDAGDGVEAP